MKIEEAKKFIKNSWLFESANENIGLKEAIVTILQELDRLQKENEELKNRNKILENFKYINGFEIEKAKLEESKRWEDKIREKIEELNVSDGLEDNIAIPYLKDLLK